MKRGEIIIVDDDADDRLLLQMVMKDLGIDNKVTFFPNGDKAITYLQGLTDAPFLIISDFNMPLMSGVELREKVQQLDKPMFRVIPFVFLSTGDMKLEIEKTRHPMQGFFAKPNNYEDLKQLVSAILCYWKRSTFPERIYR